MKINESTVCKKNHSGFGQKNIQKTCIDKTLQKHPVDIKIFKNRALCRLR